MFYTVLSILLESWLVLVFLTCNCDDAMNYIFEHLPMDVEWRSLLFWYLAAILNYIFYTDSCFMQIKLNFCFARHYWYQQWPKGAKRRRWTWVSTILQTIMVWLLHNTIDDTFDDAWWWFPITCTIYACIFSIT